MDRFFEKTNNQNEQSGTTIKELGSGVFADYSYEGATLLGVDSFNRTGECFKEQLRNEVKYTFHVGLRLLQVFFKKLTVGGAGFAASSRIGENSLELAYTISDKESNDLCDVKVNSLRVESAGKAVLYASKPNMDGMNIDKFLQDQLLPTLNRMLQEEALLMQVHDFLLRVHCRKNPHRLDHVSSLMSAVSSLIFG